MEPSKDCFQRVQNEFSGFPKLELERFWRQVIWLKSIRPDTPVGFEITVRGGRSWLGELVAASDTQVVLRHREAPFAKAVTVLSVSDIQAVGMSWSPSFGRFFSKRREREAFGPVGKLELAKNLQTLATYLPGELKLTPALEGEWNDATEEDYLILEEHLAALVRELIEFKKQFPNEVSKLSTIAFKKPDQGGFAVSGRPGTLVVALPFESSASFDLPGSISKQLNNALSQI